MREKLQEIRRKQRIFDKYIDLAVTQPTVFARKYRGFRLFVNGRNSFKAVQTLRALGTIKTVKAEMIAGGINKKFYEGDIASCVVIIEAGAYVAVRIGQDVFYCGVENKDRLSVLDIARRNKSIYDCRGIAASNLQDYGDNVVAFNF